MEPPGVESSSVPEFDLNDPAFVSVYDDLPLWSAPSGMMLLNEVPLMRGLTVLDIGCGAGFPMIELAERLGPSCTVHGLDPWAAGLARVRAKIISRRVPNAVVHQGSADAMPFADASFDLIVSNLGVNNFTRPEDCFREARRVARENAQLIIATNLRGTMHMVYEAYERALGQIGYLDAVARIDRLVTKRTALEDLEWMLAVSRFGLVRVEQADYQLRFTDGEALLSASFIRLAFVEAWLGAVEEQDRPAALVALRAELDEIASRMGGLTLTIPLACVVAVARP